jgi:hypothetical protein
MVGVAETNSVKRDGIDVYSYWMMVGYCILSCQLLCMYIICLFKFDRCESKME